MNSHICRGLIVFVLALSCFASSARAAEVKLLTAGAFKQVVLALVPDFEKQTGHKVVVDNDTAGGLKKRIESGEAFDVAVITPAVIDELAGAGKIAAGSRVNLASVSIGVVVKEGAPRPDVSTVDAFKRALLEAKSVAYIDPASGGSSGIYIDKLLERLGIADQVRPKSKLKNGGHVADLIVSGEAELGLHQISEIVPVKGAALRENVRLDGDLHVLLIDARQIGGDEDLLRILHHVDRRRPAPRLERVAAKQGRGPGAHQDVIWIGRRRGAEIQGHGAGELRTT